MVTTCRLVCAETDQQGRQSNELRHLDATSALLAALQAVASAELPAGTTDSGGLTGALQTLAGVLLSH